MPATRDRTLVKIVFLAALYWAAGRLAILAALPPGVATPIWPSSGIALAALILWGNRVAPGIFLGSLFVNLPILVAESPAGAATLASLGIAAGSTFQAVLGAGLSRRVNDGNPFTHTRSVFAFYAYQSFVCLVAATLGVASLWTSGLLPWEEFGRSWFTWWIGDLGGVLIFTSVPILIRRRAIRFPKLPNERIELSLFIGALAFFGWVVFGPKDGSWVDRFQHPYILMPVALWGAFRFEFIGAVVTSLFVFALSIWSALSGYGPFALYGVDALALFQTVVVVYSMTVFVVAAEVCERKFREMELKNSNAELARFAYVASHDLQEPLRMVTSYVQLLKRRYGDRLDNSADEYIEHAVQGARRMQQLIEDLLAFSRIGTSKDVPVQVDCNGVVEQVRKNLSLAIEESKAVVRAADLPAVRIEPTEMLQLFQNLVGNALKYRGKTPPEIHITAQAKDREYLFSIKDNGIGIEPQYFERIFVLFQRLHGWEAFPGTGIGLALCKKIVERHGGRIWVESKPGEGSIFHFTLARS